jgi:hypothetical protein
VIAAFVTYFLLRELNKHLIKLSGGYYARAEKKDLSACGWVKEFFEIP